MEQGPRTAVASESAPAGPWVGHQGDRAQGCAGLTGAGTGRDRGPGPAG